MRIPYKNEYNIGDRVIYYDYLLEKELGRGTITGDFYHPFERKPCKIFVNVHFDNGHKMKKDALLNNLNQKTIIQSLNKTKEKLEKQCIGFIFTVFIVMYLLSNVRMPLEATQRHAQRFSRVLQGYTHVGF
jgi:hypothetical protein